MLDQLESGGRSISAGGITTTRVKGFQHTHSPLTWTSSIAAIPHVNCARSGSTTSDPIVHWLDLEERTKNYTMERSSPLAAMQPTGHFFGHCGFRTDGPTSFPSLPPNGAFGTSSFNFRDLSMKKSHSDYFSLKPVRGSSPTASLAADLSQNFHIDQRCASSCCGPRIC